MRDAEISYSQSGFAFLKFSIAVNGSKKEGEKWVDDAYFFDVSLGGRQGESIASYMTKGKQVAVEGSLKQDRWTAQDGTKRSKVFINAHSVQLLGGRTESTPQAKPQGPPAPSFESDVPF